MHGDGRTAGIDFRCVASQDLSHGCSVALGSGCLDPSDDPATIQALLIAPVPVQRDAKRCVRVFDLRKRSISHVDEGARSVVFAAGFHKHRAICSRAIAVLCKENSPASFDGVL